MKNKEKGEENQKKRKRKERWKEILINKDKLCRI